MPAGPVLRIGCDRARGEITHRFGARTDQPVVIRQRDERLRVIGTLSHRALESGQRINQFFAG